MALEERDVDLAAQVVEMSLKAGSSEFLANAIKDRIVHHIDRLVTIIGVEELLVWMNQIVDVLGYDTDHFVEMQQVFKELMEFQSL